MAQKEKETRQLDPKNVKKLQKNRCFVGVQNWGKGVHGVVSRKFPSLLLFRLGSGKYYFACVGVSIWSPLFSKIGLFQHLCQWDIVVVSLFSFSAIKLRALSKIKKLVIEISKSPSNFLALGDRTPIFDPPPIPFKHYV